MRRDLLEGFGKQAFFAGEKVGKINEKGSPKISMLLDILHPPLLLADVFTVQFDAFAGSRICMLHLLSLERSSDYVV